MSSNVCIYWAFLPGTFAGNEYAAICVMADRSEYLNDGLTVALYFDDELTATAAWQRAYRAGFNVSNLGVLYDECTELDTYSFDIYVPEV